MEAAVKVPLSERINFRMLTFLVVFTALFGWIFYLMYLAYNPVIDHGTYKEVDLKAMSTFSFDQNNGKLDDIPEPWRALDGQRVQFKGEMWAPNSAAADLNRFDLVYSIAKCCTTGPPKVQHFVKSTVADNRKVPFYSQQVRVTGILHVAVKKNDAGAIESIYTLDVESLEPM